MKLKEPIYKAVVISIILHLLIFVFVKFLPENKEKDKSGDDNPVEISVIPKSTLDKEPVPENVEELEALSDAEDTTLDHNKPGGKNKGKQTREDGSGGHKSVVKKPDVNITPPKIEDSIPKELNKEDDDLPENINLFNNDNILDGILNEKKIPPKGEDTASYNKFEEKYASYFAKFRRRVYQLWQYPSVSIAKGEKGVVKVSFSILKDGSIVNIRMIESSGYSNLDREVMRVLKNMGKIPLPSSYELNQLNIDEAYFIYSIGDETYRYLR